MRQLVSVVTDQSVSYYLADHDGDQVQQVAQVLNTGLEVSDVIDLGANLLNALRLNGITPKRGIGAPATKAMKPATQPELVPADPPARKAGPAGPARRAGRPPGPAKRPMRRWGFTRDLVLSDLRAHPGTTYREACQRIAGTDEKAAQTAYSASLNLVARHLLGTGSDIRRETFTAPDAEGATRMYTRLYLEEPQTQEPQEEQ